MCGIFVARLGNKQKISAAEVVLAGLKRLEYRGYDSWGVAVVMPGPITVEKHAGQIGQVVQPLSLPFSQVAIGHTRWATHGGVTDLNAHPHLASDGSFALVQNGVVENYQVLKAELETVGAHFISQTDTEVIVRLIETQKKPGQSLELHHVVSALQRCTGRNTVAVLTQEGTVLAVRQGSPLILGRHSAGEVFLSSDVLSLASVASEFVAVENGQAVVISPDGMARIWSIEREEWANFSWQPIAVKQLQLSKEGEQFFTRKEIYEQARVLVRPLAQPAELWSQFIQKLKGARQIYLIGAGSADFVGQQIAFSLRQAGLPAQAIKAYEARSFQSLFGIQDVGIAVSQSGETADTIEVVEWMKAAGMTTASIVNMPGSTISALSDLPFMLQIGPEVGIASTKAVTAATSWGLVVAELCSDKSLTDFTDAVASYQTQIADWLSTTETSDAFLGLLEQLATAPNLYILGKGQLYAAGQESALKLKELAYLHAESFSGGELKHGVLALIEKGTPVMCLIADDTEQAEMLNAAAQVKARGAVVIGVAAKNDPVFDIWLPVLNQPQFAMISAVLPAQLLGYHLALRKGFNPDKPRNLAKSVTVK